VEAEVVFVEVEVNKQSQIWITRVLCATMLVLASACGSSSSNGLPTANNPSTGNNTPINTTPNTDSRLPDWLDNRVDIVLPSCTGTSSICDTGKTTSGLGDIFGVNVGGLVETHFNLQLPNASAFNITGATVNLGYEDSWGFSGASIPGFDGAVTNQNGQIDMIFSDSLTTVRVTGNYIGSTDQIQAGTIYYKVRQSADTQCQRTTYSCWVNYGNGPQPSSSCTGTTPTNTDVSVCKSYMGLGSAGVKQLGTFTSSYSRWAK
jgi:hypothetical protein